MSEGRGQEAEGRKKVDYIWLAQSSFQGDEIGKKAGSLIQ